MDIVQIDQPENEINNYDYFDINPKVGYNFYQINYVDNEGQTVATEEVNTLLFNPQEDERVLLYPNPVSEFMIVEFIDNVEDVDYVTVVDVLGVERKSVTTINPQLNLDLTGFAEGVYFINVHYKMKRNRTFKFFKKTE